MQAFGLHICGKMDEAEKMAEKALALNGNDRWACMMNTESNFHLFVLTLSCKSLHYYRSWRHVVILIMVLALRYNTENFLTQKGTSKDVSIFIGLYTYLGLGDMTTS